MSSFTRFSGPLHTVYATEASRILKKEHWWIDPGFSYYLNSDKDETVEVPTGYLSDGASVPVLIRWLLPAWGIYGQCAVLHDYLCETWRTNKRFLTRKELDNIFFESMVVAKVPKWKQKLITFGVNIYRLIARPNKPSYDPLKDKLSMEYIN